MKLFIGIRNQHLMAIIKAMYNLASIYINGDGVNSSISQAEYWLKKSALKGNKRAINILSNNN